MRFAAAVAALTALFAASPAVADDATVREQILQPRAAEFSALVVERGLAYGDPELTPYLDELLAALDPAHRFRVVVLREPSEERFVMQDASIYLGTGVLARLDDESQLALLVALQMSHLELDHLAKYQSALRSSMKAVKIGALFDPYLVGLWPATISLRKTLSGFSDDMTLAAARPALARLAAAGYANEHACALFRAFDPANPALEEGCRRAAARKSGRDDVERLRRATARVTLEHVRLLLEEEQYEQAGAAIQRAMSRHGQTALLWSYEGQRQLALATLPKHVPYEEIPRSVPRRDREAAEAKILTRLRKDEPGQLAAAAAAFREALALEPGLGSAQRGLGETLLAQRDLDGARAQFDQYLAGNATAYDAKLVRRLREKTLPSNTTEAR